MLLKELMDLSRMKRRAVRESKEIKKKPSTRAPTNPRTATVVALQLEGPLRHQAKRTDRIRLKT